MYNPYRRNTFNRYKRRYSRTRKYYNNAFKRKRKFPATKFRTLARTGGLLPGKYYEQKYIDKVTADIALPIYNDADWWDIYHINDIDQGTGASERDGNKITMTHINIKGNIESTRANNVGFQNQQRIRMMLVYDRQANGVAPTLTEVLENATINDNSTMNSHLSKKSGNRFRVLIDKIITSDNSVGGVGSASSPNAQKVIHFNFKKRFLLPTLYNGNPDGAIANIMTGSLHLMWFRDCTHDSTNTDIGNIQLIIRLLYSDKQK